MGRDRKSSFYWLTRYIETSLTVSEILIKSFFFKIRFQCRWTTLCRLRRSLMSPTATAQRQSKFIKHPLNQMRACNRIRELYRWGNYLHVLGVFADVDSVELKQTLGIIPLPFGHFYRQTFRQHVLLSLSSTEIARNSWVRKYHQSRIDKVIF